jgi:hypothetical protein
MNEITFEFDELALIVEGGFEAALIAGNATIRFENDGEWSIQSIALDGHRKRSWEERERLAASSAPYVPRLFERKPVHLCKDSNPWLYGAIVDRLEHHHADDIAYAIGEAKVDARDEYRAQLGKDRARGLER